MDIIIRITLAFDHGGWSQQSARLSSAILEDDKKFITGKASTSRN
jgi:hypothetical protein